LKRDFPHLEISINGGIKTLDEVEEHLKHVDGVMLGREAYHNPYVLAGVDSRFYGADTPVLSREAVEASLIDYARQEVARGTFLGGITRHALGLYRGVAGCAWLASRALGQPPSRDRRLWPFSMKHALICARLSNSSNKGLGKANLCSYNLVSRFSKPVPGKLERQQEVRQWWL